MSVIELKAKRRPTGKQEAKKIRREGQVPGVFYFHGQDPIPFVTETLALRPIVYTAHTHIINLQVEGEAAKECVLKDIVFDPVTDKIMHIDLMGVKTGEKVTVDVPLVFKGQAVGIRMGGLVQQEMHKIKVTCQPTDIPDSIVIDITNLGLGDAIFVKNLDVPDVHIEVPAETVIVHIIQPRVAAEATDTAPAEGEQKEESK